MNSPQPAILISFIAPALVLVMLLHALVRCFHRPPVGWVWLGGLTAVAVGIVVLPLQGLPLARWLAGLVDHWSIPTLALLVARVAQDFFRVELLRRKDQQAAWMLGAVAGATLYPLAIGLGAYDPYSLGWHFGPLPAGVAVVTVVLLWRRIRFGVVLLLAAGAWSVGVPESGNYWDCLMDPFYSLASLGALGAELWRRTISPPRHNSP